MSPPDLTPTIGSLPDGVAERLDRLRCRLLKIDTRCPEGLMELRGELEALQSEAEGEDRPGLASALRRLAMMTEVWECLAAERAESAQAAASFCVRALEHIASAAGADGVSHDLSWIFQESSACWSVYLGLIDPSGNQGIAAGENQVSDTNRVTGLDVDAESALPEIDASTLFQMLTGSALPARKPEAGPPASQSRAKATERGDLPRGGGSAEPCQTAAPLVGEKARTTSPSEPVTARVAEPKGRLSSPSPAQRLAAIQEIDAEFREAFLSEALDLFERIESLVLNLSRGTGHESTLHELGRCFHTLKGAAGSVGLIELASRVHYLEQGLEDAAGEVTPQLLDELRQALGHLEGVLDSLRMGSGPGARPEPRVEQGLASAESLVREELLRHETSRSRPGGEEEKPAADEPLSTEPADGPIRIPSSRMDELMDLASELIARRGVWAAQAERLKEFGAMIRACRNNLQIRLDGLNELGLARMAHAEVGGRTIPGRPDRDAKGGTNGAATVVLRLTEQVEDLAVLTEAAQAQALPLADDSDTLARLTLQLWETLQSIRIVPIRGLFQRLARVAHDAARVEGREVEVVMVGEETGLDRAVQDKAFEPLLHVVRNAVGHGIESPEVRTTAGKPVVGRVTLEARREGNTLVLSVQDDGRGLDYAAIAEKGRRLGLLGPDDAAGPEQLSALIFRSGFSTRDEANAISGRGVGMDVVAQEVRRLRGTTELKSQPGLGTRLTVRLPARLALEQVMITRVAGQAFALPIALIEHAQAFDRGDVEGTGSHATVRVRDHRVPLIVARDALGFSATAPASCPKLLLVRAEGKPLALLFDAIEGTCELVIKPFGPLLAGHPVIWGTSLSLTGDVIFIINPSGLFHWLCEGNGATVPANESVPRPAPVLVVDDSISVRRVVSRQLRMLGLEVEEVSNGVEALGKLSTRPYSMVLTDLEMPRMDGFELLAEMQRSAALAALPVIVASTESRPTTRRRALALGARAFLAKPIDQDELARVAGTIVNCAIANTEP
jgi:chemotaxis protein histidine kinase CheA/ActR/RegA family two-component response regulator